MAKGSAPIKKLLEGIKKPSGTLKNVAAVGGGFVAAQVGGALAKQIDAVENFAAGGPVQEAVVDFGGGVAVDAVALGALAAFGKKGAAKKAAPLVLAGTAVGAFAPLAAPYIADGIDKLVGLVVGGGAPAVPSSSRVAPTGRQLGSGNLLQMQRAPGGLYELAPGGIYDGAAAF